MNRGEGNRLEIMNELSALIPYYNETILAYMKAMQAISISIEASLAYVKQVMSVVGFRDQETESNLIQIFPGVPHKVDTGPKKFMKGNRSRTVSNETTFSSSEQTESETNNEVLENEELSRIGRIVVEKEISGLENNKLLSNAMKLYLNCDNYLSALYRKCLFLEQPLIYTKLIDEFEEEVDNLLRSETVNKKSNNALFHIEPQLSSIKANRYLNDSSQFYMTDNEMQEFGITKLICDSMINSNSLFSDNSLRWSEWLQLIEIFDFAIRIDLSVLQNWR
jgi:hypothetical protein